VHDHLTALEKAMETDLSRARSLSGVDPNTGQLRVTMEKVYYFINIPVNILYGK